jgi:hypothetical protein
MSSFPVDAVVVLLLFIISAPVLFVQFTERDVQYVLTHRLKETTRRNMTFPGLVGFGMVVIFFALSYLLGVHDRETVLSDLLLLLLFGLVIYILLIFLPILRKQNIIQHLKEKVINCVRTRGSLSEEDLNAITFLGMESQAGDEKFWSIQALGEITLAITQRADDHRRQIELPLESLRKVLFSGKQKGSPENFNFTVDVLKPVIQAYYRKGESTSSFPHPDLNLVYQFLTQVALEAVNFPSEEVVLACIAAMKAPSTKKIPTSRWLREVGTTAVLRDKIASALEVLHTLEAALENVDEPISEILFDYIGLLSAFWQHGESAQKMVKGLLDTLKNKPAVQVRKLIGQSIQHYSHAAEFSTADRIRSMWDSYLRLP